MRRETQIVLFGKTEGKRQLGRPRRIWSDIIVKNLTVGWKGVDWIDRTQDREDCRDPAKTVTKHRVPYNAENLLTSSGTGGFCKGTLFHGVGYNRHFGGRL